MDIPKKLRDVRQWVLWRYEGTQDKPTKVPYQVNRSRASSVDPSHWSTFEQAKNAWVNGEGFFTGIGFVITREDDFVGIDLDNCIDAQGNVAEWAREIIEQIDSYTEISPSQRGVKIFALGKVSDDRKKKVAIEDGAIEVYTHGRYFTVTGDHFEKSRDVAQADAGLHWIEKEYLPKQAASFSQPSRVYTPSEGERVSRADRYIDAYPAAVSGQDGHGVTFRLACVLVNGFNLNRVNALNLLSRYNAKCEPAWSDKELEHKIDSAFEQDGPRGFMLDEDEQFRKSIQVVPDSELDRFDVYIDDLLTSFKDETRVEIPQRLLEVPGFIGDCATWFNSQNHRDNKPLAVLGAIALQALIIGRKVRDKSGNRSNLYLVALSPSGTGKQAPQTCIKKILNLSDQSELYSGKVASDSAIAEDLMHSANKLFLWDEFGRFLKKTQEKRGGVHLHGVQEVLLELWNETSTLWKHKSVADRANSRAVNHPCCSFLGYTVASQFWQGLEREHLGDGFAARLIVVDLKDDDPPEQDVEESDPPKSIMEIVQFWKDKAAGGNLAQINPTPSVVPSTEEADEIFSRLSRENRKRKRVDDSIWSRAAEKAKRLALVYACSKDHEAPLIDKSAAQWACDFVSFTTEAFIGIAEDEIVESDQFSQRRKQVLQRIKEFSRRKQQCTRTHLMKRMKLRKRDLDEVISSLIESGVIDEIQVATKGRPAVAYVAK